MEHIGEIMKEQGLPSSGPVSVENSEPEYQCKICLDAGLVHPVVDGKTDFSQVIPCHCQKEVMKERRARAYLKFCRLPAGTEKMTLDNFDTYSNESLIEAHGIAILLAMDDESIRWLTLLSQVDRGKTHLAVAVCRAWLERGHAARYTFVPLLLKELRDGFELQGERSYRVQLDALCNVPLLVLDDLGVEKASEWAQEQIQTIVHYRGINKLPLIVTSNRELDNMPIDPDRRIASRLQRESWCRVVVIDAPEHSQQKEKK